ncbi:MAG: sulfotransferase domain-containing protein [Planctomycetes bacterium]|nr:sulfotransferase domain-containing protein [Planctomycetota bacterium]
MVTKLPNFLVVGAAKSGTTSLYYYLKQHPQVYLSRVKECKFFSNMTADYVGPGDDEDLNMQIIKSIDEYTSLFSTVTHEKAIGDISPDYLYYYENSIKNIKSLLGDKVRIVIILRNPVDRAYSNYLHHRREGIEKLSFEDALIEEDYRISQNWGWGWHRTKSGFYYKQVKAFIENFPHVRVYLYEDLENNVLGLVKDMFAYLNVDTSFAPDTNIKFNVSGIPKNKFINDFLTKPNLPKKIIKTFLKSFLPDDQIKRLKETLRSRNLDKPKMKPETKKYLNDLYKEDIIKLQNLINRNLSHWMQ